MKKLNHVCEISLQGSNFDRVIDCCQQITQCFNLTDFRTEDCLNCTCVVDFPHTETESQ